MTAEFNFVTSGENNPIDKNKTGRTMKRNDWHMEEGDYYISVLGVIRRSDGRFLITQRVMTKEWAPGWWEIPGGSIKAGQREFTGS